MISGLDIDHVMIACDEPEADFRAFQSATGLPEAWPYSDFGAIKTGAVWAGKTAIEFARLEGAKPFPTRLAGLAFSTDLEAWDLAETLKQLGIAHVPPTHIAPDPEGRMAWTNTVIGGFLRGEPKTMWLGRRFGGASGLARWMSRMVEGMLARPGGLKRLNSVIGEQMAFFIAFEPKHEADERREQARTALTTEIGVAIELGLPEAGRERDKWQALLSAAPVLPAQWVSPSGVFLRFLPANEATLECIRLYGCAPLAKSLPDHLANIIQFD